MEIRLFCELKTVFEDVRWRAKVKRVECDVLLPDVKIAIEHDGSFYHRDKKEKDRNKSSKLRRAGYQVIRVREEGLPKLGRHDVIYQMKESHLSVITHLLHELLSVKRAAAYHAAIRRYLRRGRLANGHEFRRVLSYLPGPPPEKSLAQISPKTAKLWHYENNAPLTPEMFTPKSNQVVWWKCEKRKDHAHQMAIDVKQRMSNPCPKCYEEQLPNYTIRDMRRIAKEKKGRCLSKTYVNNHTNLRWQCKNKHEWGATPKSVINGNWCRRCAGLERLTIDEMRAIAEERGGKCLSKKYINSKTSLRWECSEGHRWKASPGKVKSGKWCRKCYHQNRHSKYSISDMQNIAASRGGKCLSSVYVNNKTPLEWECEKGHRWTVKPENIIKGTWCRECTNTRSGERRRKYTIEDMHRLAEERGGKCLSQDYVSNKSKLEWRCEAGHRWLAVPYDLVRGSWCRKCIHREIAASEAPQRLAEMRKLARQQNGRCLSDQYINSQTPLKWKCSKGHTWMATPSSVTQGSWCRFCAGTARLTIEEMRQIAKNRKGKCLSSTYKNNRTKLKWQCKNGHQWMATPHSVKAGSWCKKCYEAGRRKRE